MSGPSPLPRRAVHVMGGEPAITIRIAALAWLAAWVGGNVVASFVVAATGKTAGEVDTPVWVTLVGSLALWAPMVLVLVEVGRRYGTGSVAEDYRLRFAPVDLIGLPVGFLSQLVLLKLVYWPLEAIWPSTFSTPRMEENARTLYDSAQGGWLVVLVLIVVVGAPLVEELLYRGLLQGAFVRQVDEIVSVVAVAAWFAIIHFRPVEYPGLFVFGLVLGTCSLVTRRLGMSVLAHVAFNTTGLVWVATR